MYVKVSKSQKYFFLKIHCPKTNNILDKILPYEAREEFFLTYIYFVHFLGIGVSRKIAFEIY